MPEDLKHKIRFQFIVAQTNYYQQQVCGTLERTIPDIQVTSNNVYSRTGIRSKEWGQIKKRIGSEKSGKRSTNGIIFKKLAAHSSVLEIQFLKDFDETNDTPHNPKVLDSHLGFRRFVSIPRHKDSSKCLGTEIGRWKTFTVKGKVSRFQPNT